MTTVPPPTALRRPLRPSRTALSPVAVLVVLVGVAGLVAVAGCGSPASPSVSSGAAPASVTPRRSTSSPHRTVADPPGQPSSQSPSQSRSSGRRHGPVGAADGVVPDGVTVFDDEYPAVARLEPALLAALRRAARDAADDGVALYVNSGWRSPAYQEQLLQQAIATYGSRARAARWVATPTTSPHVAGEAVDVGRSTATRWLARHGAGYGLCQIYRNEPWHYELRPRAVDHGCPAPYADPTHDPRMQ